ncbi:PREDICTED: uncharacterized protein LOC101376679 [Odobenus rosmarus divergens]|uniref:Uncharacterized protein LOC101376679 n=1 Tax=Odobenus rosmarus divergens TaxID=9708 RepID=A0A9B0LJ94_ODORO
MEVPRRSPPGEAPWKKLSKEELENQYSPSRWVIRQGAEETLRTYSHIGDEGTGGPLHGCRGWTLAGGSGSECWGQEEALRAIPKVQALCKPCRLRARHPGALATGWLEAGNAPQTVIHLLSCSANHAQAH